MAYVYLLHFDAPISDKHTCQHYIGFTSRTLTERITEHRKGQGARLTQVAKERGIGFRVVRTWANGTRSLERQLKNQKMGNRLCPICTGKPIRCRVK